MIYQLQRIVRDVRVAMEENRRSEALIADGDVETLGLDELIASKIEQSARWVVLAAPVHMLEGTRWFGNIVYWGEEGAGWTPLPEDFLRLVVFRMSDWERPVYTAITPDNPKYGVQHSRYRGLRGTPQKPVCALVRRSVGLVLEFYSCRSEDADVDQALYMAVPKVDKGGGIEIPEECYRSMVYHAAGLTLTTMGAGELGSALIELSKSILA